MNRVHKRLEDANIKLASVATDVMGVSGRNMLQAIIDGRHIIDSDGREFCGGTFVNGPAKDVSPELCQLGGVDAIETQSEDGDAHLWFSFCGCEPGHVRAKV